MRKLYYSIQDFTFLQIVRGMIGAKDFSQLHFTKSYKKCKKIAKNIVRAKS